MSTEHSLAPEYPELAGRQGVGTWPNSTPLTPLAFLARAETVFADKTAAVQGERRLSYAEFGVLVDRVANALRGAGIQPGDRVAYLATNNIELLAAHFAVPLCGAALVAINTRLSGAEISYILGHSGARVLVLDAQFEDFVERIKTDAPNVERIVMIGGSAPGAEDYAEFIAAASTESLPRTVDYENRPLSINYTSGTTGRPKGVVYSHRGAYLNSLGEIIHSGHSAASVYLWTLPMFHCNGWCTPWAVTAAGGTHICLPKVDAEEAWRLIDEERVTHLNAAPTVLVSLLNAERTHRLDREVVVTTAGAPPSSTTIGQLSQLGFRVVHVYGLTEVYGPYTVCERQPAWQQLPDDEQAELLSRQGVGMVQTDGVRVVDGDMNDVPRDGETIGEIVMRGNNVMLGYYADPAATEEAFSGGWFHSGDLAVWHPDGYVEIRDRAKDIIVSGGENISTVELENTIMAHHAVLEAAVVGVPDERWGERPKAFVIRKPDQVLTADELIEHVRERLARFKAPRDVEFVDELPKTSTGKIQKFQLRG